VPGGGCAATRQGGHGSRAPRRTGAVRSGRRGAFRSGQSSIRPIRLRPRHPVPPAGAAAAATWRRRGRSRRGPIRPTPAGTGEGKKIARARLTIDLDAVAANWRALDALSAPEVETAAVVKADAYGLGMAQVARRLRAAGVRSFFVALAEEGVALRGILGPGPAIYVLSGLMRGDAPLCAGHDLVPCLNSPEDVEAFASALPGRKAALQIDSGMNRLGIEPTDLDRVAGHLAGIDLTLVLSHLACADEPDHPANADQAAAFAAALAALAARGRGGWRTSLAATGGILLGPAYHHDMVRPGIGLYGGLPFEAARPVLRLSLPVIQVRDVLPGEMVGYGAAFRAERPARIATVAAGYADGLIRRLGEGGLMLRAGGIPCPVVGRISMDLVTVDVTALTACPDQLEILDEVQGIDAVAAAAGTIGYEILTALGGRYDRVYKGLPEADAPDPSRA
jgi:alanine racemase